MPASTSTPAPAPSLETAVNAATTIRDYAVLVGTALADYAHLPCDALHVYRDKASIGMPSSYMPGFRQVREVAQWASAFDAPIIISLSSTSNGRVETNVELGGVPVSVSATIGTAQAYGLGGVLKRPLSQDVSIQISAADLLAAVDAAEAVSR